jgi:hypothetical protein
MIYFIPPEHIDQRHYTQLPPGQGVLFTMRFSQWLTDHFEQAQISMVNGRVAVNIIDPVVQMSFQALGD